MNTSIPQPHPIGKRELAAGTVVFCQSSPPNVIFRHVIDALPGAGAFILDHHGSALPLIIHELNRINRLQDLVVLSPCASFATATLENSTGLSVERSAMPIGDIPSEIEEQTSLELPTDPASALRMLTANIGRTFSVAQSGLTLTESRIISRSIRMGSSLFIPRSLAPSLAATGLKELLLDGPATHSFNDTLTKGTIFVWHAPQLASSIPVGRILLRQFRTAMRQQLGNAHDHGRSVLCFISGAAEEYLAGDDIWLRPGALSSASVVDVFGVTRIPTWNMCDESGGTSCEESLGLRVFCGDNPLLRFKEGKWLKRAGLHSHSACGLNTVVGGDGNKGFWVRTWPFLPTIAGYPLLQAIRNYWALQIRTADTSVQ